MDVSRFSKGQKMINQLHQGADEKLLSGLGSTAPDLAKYVMEFVFGDIYARDGLDLKTKQMLTITILAVLGNAKPQLLYHIRAAINIGITKQELIDIMTHISAYAGFPAALNGVNAIKEVFEQNE